MSDGTAAAATRAACVVVIVTWALIAAAGSAYRFVWSTQAIQNPGDATSFWGPAWVQTVGYLIALVGVVGRRPDRAAGPAPEVAERAGHSVEVLLRVYAECLDDG